MARVTTGPAKNRARKRLLKRAKGYWGARSKLIVTARDAVTRAGVYSFAHRRKRKGDFRRLWITRLTAACRARGASYSKFINALAKAKVELDRKTLSELAIRDSRVFDHIFKFVMPA